MSPTAPATVLSVLLAAIAASFFIVKGDDDQGSSIIWGASDAYQPHVTIKMKEFYQPRKSQRVVVTSVKGKQVPLYGGGASISSSPEAQVSLYLNLTFTIRSRAYVLGKLVKPVFRRSFLCPVVLRRTHIGKPVHLNQTCFDSP